MKKLSYLFMISILYFSSVVFAQEIKLKSGQTIKGSIIKRTKKYIVVDQGLGVPVTYYMDVDKQLGEEKLEEATKKAVEEGSKQGELIENEPSPPKPKDPVQAPRTPLPEVVQNWSPNISEDELKKVVEVYVQAVNFVDVQWLSNFIGEDAKFFSTNKDFYYKYSGQDYINILKASRDSGQSISFDISIDQIDLEGPQATTEETVKKKTGASLVEIYRQRNTYNKIDGEIKLKSSELLMDR